MRAWRGPYFLIGRSSTTTHPLCIFSLGRREKSRDDRGFRLCSHISPSIPPELSPLPFPSLLSLLSFLSSLLRSCLLLASATPFFCNYPIKVPSFRLAAFPTLPLFLVCLQACNSCYRPFPSLIHVHHHASCRIPNDSRPTHAIGAISTIF